MIYYFEDDKEDIENKLKEIYEAAGIIHNNILNVGASFDIETTQINEGDKHHAYMYVWQFGIEDAVIIGRTWAEFLQFYTLLVNCLQLGQKIYPKRKTSPKRKLICLVHNLAFEWSFICKRLPWALKKTKEGYIPQIFAKDAHNVITAVTKDNLEFRCTLNLTGKSLAKLAKDYGLTAQKQVGKLDYLVNRNSKTPLSPEETDYIIYDVKILVEYFHKYYAPTFLTGKKIPTTKTSIIRNELRDHFEKTGAKQPKGFPKTIDFYKWLMNWVFRGGYVHANAYYTQWEIFEILYSYDFKSSYPARMLLWKFPYEFKKYKGDPYRLIKRIPKVEEDTAVLFTAKFYNIRSRYSHSLESVHKCIDSSNVYVDNGRVSKADFIEVALTEQDYLSYLDCYNWDSMEIVGTVYTSKKEPLPPYLLDLTCKYYYIKSTIDDILHPLDYILSKENVNSLYGMLCSSILHDSYIWNGEELDKKEIPIDYEAIRKKQILLPQHGVYVSAYARREEVRMMLMLTDKKTAYSDAIYGDTDSWKVRHPERYEGLFDDYNKEIDNKLMSLDLSGLDFDFIGCKDEEDLKHKIMGIGHFEHESTIDHFRTLGCKRYIMSETKKGHRKVVVKCAGMKSDRFLAKMGDAPEHCIYKWFDFNLELSAEESGKLCHCYNTERHSDVIIDTYGNKERMTEKSSICLFPIPFKMRSFEDYIAFFEELQEQEGRKI